MNKLRLNCPELYHIQYLYQQKGMGHVRIAEALERNTDFIEAVVRGKHKHHAAIIGRLTNGKRPASQLTRSWKKKAK